VIYGQFTGDRDLRRFYRSVGFDVRQRGEPLNMEAATGIPKLVLVPRPDETYFPKTAGCPV